MKHRRSHFTPYILHFTLIFAAAFSGVAKTLSWRLHQEPAAATFAAYHGETVEFAPVASNVVFEAIYYQTNGMGRTWWRTDGLVFHPTNDVGASAYRFFVAGHDATGRDWRANGLLRMLDSPGFEPAEVELPVKTLDFAAIEIANAPWPAEIAAATNATLAAAKGYTDTVAAGIVDEFTNKVDRIGGSARELKVYDGLTIAPAQMRNGTSAIFDEGAVRLTTVGPSGVNYREVLWPSTAGTLALAAANPTADNLAALDASGNPKDSGKKSTDFAGVEAVAPAFRTNATYHSGDLVMYNGLLYYCTATHTGPFTPSDFSPWDMAAETDDLWGAFDDLDEAVRGAKPLKFVAATSPATVTMAKVGSFTLDLSLECSTDGGSTWTDYTVGTTMNLETVGASVMFRAKGVNEQICPNVSGANYHNFQVTGQVAAYGDLTSLLGPVADPATPLPQRCFNCLFINCAGLVKAPELPATRLGARCYQSLFNGCTGLTESPYLPATTLASSCYANMFLGATNMTEVSAAFSQWNPVNATANWLSNVAESGKFIGPPIDVSTRGDSTIPTGWEAYRSKPGQADGALPATGEFLILSNDTRGLHMADTAGVYEASITPNSIATTFPDGQEHWIDFPSTRGTFALAAPSATAGNLAALDAQGNPVDSGVKPNDFKTKQTAKPSPSASGSSDAFIENITQDANGVITATKKNVLSAATNHPGIVQLNTSTNSTSTTMAATPSAVRQVAITANQALAKANAAAGGGTPYALDIASFQSLATNLNCRFMGGPAPGVTNFDFTATGVVDDYPANRGRVIQWLNTTYASSLLIGLDGSVDGDCLFFVGDGYGADFVGWGMPTMDPLLWLTENAWFYEGVKGGFRITQDDGDGFVPSEEVAWFTIELTPRTGVDPWDIAALCQQGDVADRSNVFWPVDSAFLTIEPLTIGGKTYKVLTMP